MLPLLTAATSILWTFGLMGWLGIPLNVVTSTIPILLIVVGSTEDIHLLAEFRHAQRNGCDVPDALQRMARKMGRTVLLTFVTTTPASCRSASVTSRCCASSAWSPRPPAVQLRRHHHPDPRRPRIGRALPARWWPPIHRWSASGRHVTGVSGPAALAGRHHPGGRRRIDRGGNSRITVNHSPVETLGSDSPVAGQLQHLSQHFAGLESFSIVISRASRTPSCAAT